MRDLVLPALLTATEGGTLPVICDATSCTEGLEVMRGTAGRAGSEYSRLRFVDAIEFVHDTLIDRLPAITPAGSVTLHPTCSSTQLNLNDAFSAIARRLAVEVHVPLNWGCCGFAGDRGMLHPELTAAATAPEAAEVCAGDFELHASTNRTCEIGMTRATGKSYRHILELLEKATRPL
jgi:D-lactate dehydrogenase